MSYLTNYRPLARIDLPGIGEIDPSGLIVLVGPNSSGKSQLLQDLNARMTGAPRSLVVADQITSKTWGVTLSDSRAQHITLAPE